MKEEIGIWEIEGEEDTMRTKTSKLADQSSCKLKQQPTQSGPGPLHLYYSFQFSISMELLNV